jgi:myo-inositol 2-dehydrogenase/D-chiro-inositol 1-dehydrogenase
VTAPDRRIRIGVIGCGAIARRAHLPALARLAGQARVVATADVNLAAAEAAAADWGADSCDDYRRVLGRSDVDVVLVATPEFLHREQVTAAAQAGKHVLCEKPMAPSVADADAMIEACATAGVRLMIGHSRRFTLRYLRIHGALDRGDIGDVRLMRENERRAQPPGGGYWAGGHWTGDPGRSVGTALTNGIHETDLMRWFTGSEPVAVAAEHRVTIAGNRGVPDFLTFTVRFADGAVGSSELVNCAPAGYPSFHQLELYGTTGSIRARDHDCASVAEYHPDRASFPGIANVLLHDADAYTREHAAFLAALRDDAPVPLPPGESRAALRLALAAVEAAETGRVAELPLPGEAAA